MLRVRKGERLLFIGDSITEACREVTAPPLGTGYVQIVNCMLAAKHPTVDLIIENLGIAGETVADLATRWEADVIAARPDWLFVMIGANDVLYAHTEEFSDRAVGPEPYREIYRSLLSRTREAFDCRIVVMDSTPLEEDPHSPSHVLMRERGAIVRDLAEEFGCERIEMFERLYEAICLAPKRGWLVDVPHPNLKGHAVLALAVLEHLNW